MLLHGRIFEYKIEAHGRARCQRRKGHPNSSAEITIKKRNGRKQQTEGGMQPRKGYTHPVKRTRSKALNKMCKYITLTTTVHNYVKTRRFQKQMSSAFDDNLSEQRRWHMARKYPELEPSVI